MKVICDSIFVILVVFGSTVQTDEIDSFRIAATLAPLTKNEHVFSTQNSNDKNSSSIVRHNQVIKEVNTTPSGITVPKYFPKVESEVGASIKSFDENLLHKENATSQKPAKDIEIDDLLRKGNNLTNSTNPNPSPKVAVVPDKVDKQAELIENGDNTEDNRVLSDHHGASSLEASSQSEPAVVGHSSVAALVVGGLVLVAALCYIGLLSWRRYLERKYGSRQILVNEDDFSIEDPNDMRHFSI